MSSPCLGTYQDLGHLTPSRLSVYQPIIFPTPLWIPWNVTSVTSLPIFLSSLSMLSCHIAPHKLLNSGSNPESEVSGLLHTIRQTCEWVNTLTRASTSCLWFHITAGPLTRSLILLFVLGLLLLSKSNPHAGTVRAACSKAGKKSRFWGLGPAMDFLLRNPFAKLLSYGKMRAIVRR